MLLTFTLSSLRRLLPQHLNRPHLPRLPGSRYILHFSQVVHPYCLPAAAPRREQGTGKPNNMVVN